jgi:hypothetical protein
VVAEGAYVKMSATDDRLPGKSRLCRHIRHLPTGNRSEWIKPDARDFLLHECAAIRAIRGPPSGATSQSSWGGRSSCELVRAI